MEEVQIVVTDFTDNVPITIDSSIDNVSLYITKEPFPIIIDTDYLDVSSAGNGVVESIPASGDVNDGSLVILNAIPDVGFEFSKWVINGIDNLNRLYSFYISEPVTAVAQFIASGYQAILKTFTNAPKDRGKWYHGDYSGNDNDSEIKNVRVAKFGTVGNMVNSSVYQQGGQEVDIEIELIMESVVNQLIFTTIAMGINKGLLLYSASNGLWYLQNGDGTTVRTVINFSLKNLGYNKLRIQWNGLTGGLLTLTITDKDTTTVYTSTATYSWVGNSSYTLRLGHATGTLNAKAIRMYVKNYFEWILNHGQDSVVYDISGNGNNGVVTGAVLATFWGSTADGIEPYDTTLGATLYEADVVYLSGELITNGSFDNGGAGWTPTAQCSVSNGYGHILSSDGSYQNISQGISGGALNKHFLLELDVIENISGGINAQFNGSGLVYPIIGLGHKKIYITSNYSGVAALFFGRIAGTTDIKIDNISLRETLNPYTSDDGTIMPICYNKPEAITGFTRLGWFPAGSGILKGLPNKYNLVGNSEVPAGDYTADQIASFTNSEIVEVTQNANAVTQLILKQ